MDGIRLDAADVLDFNYMQCLRQVANEVKPDFWLMGEVIHGDYNRWVNEGTLHSVTNYHLHKALYSGHNDHNFFEIAHTVKRLYEMGGNRPEGLKLYNFVDNHDVERIYTKLTNKAHFTPVHILLYTLPGVPSIYYGSEFGIEGKKERNSDDSLRPALNLSDYKDAVATNSCTSLVAALGKIRQATKALSYGDYKELMLTNRQYAFSRNYEGTSVVVTVNNDDSDFVMTVPAGSCTEYIGALSGQKVSVTNGTICVNVKANSGDIWIPLTDDTSFEDVKSNTITSEEPLSSNNASEETKATASSNKNTTIVVPTLEETANEEVATTNETPEKETSNTEEVSVKIETPIVEATSPSGETFSYDASIERGKIAGLQEAILAIMEKNGPITDQMRKDVMDNVYHDSLINWIKSFR